MSQGDDDEVVEGGEPDDDEARRSPPGAEHHSDVGREAVALLTQNHHLDSTSTPSGPIPSLVQELRVPYLVMGRSSCGSKLSPSYLNKGLGHHFQCPRER
jgi:hypothetical protein